MEKSLVQNINDLKNLPANWKVLPFQQVLKDVSAGNKKIKKGELNIEGILPVIDQGKSLIAGYSDILKDQIKSKPPHIVFGDHTRNLKFIDFSFAMGADGTKCLQVKDSAKYDPKFIYYFLTTLAIPDTGYNRHFKYLKSAIFPIPPLSTQKRIASILDQADRLIQLNKKLITKYEELAQSLFFDMFGDPYSNSKNFQVKLIRELCKVKGGKRVPKGEALIKSQTPYPYIKAGNIKNGIINSSNIEYLEASTYKKISRYTVEKGDVCLTVVGANIGDVGVVPEELDGANLTENANKLLIKNNLILNKTYLAKYLASNYFQTQINHHIRAAGVPKLAIFRIEETPIMVPPIKDQTNFENAIGNLNMQKSLINKSLEQSKTLFQSLLQKAYRGKLIKFAEYETA